MSNSMKQQVLFATRNLRGFDIYCKSKFTHRQLRFFHSAQMDNSRKSTLDFWKDAGKSYKDTIGMTKAVLIDLSGTLHIENEPTHEAAISLKRLRTAGLKIKFVTNTTKESKKILYDKLKQIGFDLKIEEIFTSLTAAANYLKNNNFSANLLIEDCAKEDFIGIATDVVKPDSVVIGLAPTKFNYETLNLAFRQIMDGANIVAVHKGKYFAKKGGLALGPGPFVASLEYATGKEATVIGKPSKDFFMAALKDLDCTPLEAIMIGDDVTDDVLGAIDAGIIGVLVKTGKYIDGDERKLPLDKPHLIANSFSNTVKYILVAVASNQGIPIENMNFDELALKINCPACIF